MTSLKKSSNKSLTYQSIFFGLAITILLFESVFILISGFKKGVFKKEVLSKKSTLGFDFKIIVK